MLKTKTVKAERIYRDWTCKEFLFIQFELPVNLHYFEKRVRDPHLHDHVIHAIGSQNLREDFKLSDWNNILTDLCLWPPKWCLGSKPWDVNPQRKSKYERLLPLLPGNDGYSKGDLIHHLVVLDVREEVTEMGSAFFYTLLDGDKVIEDYPYHIYCSLHDDIILPSGVRIWKK